MRILINLILCFGVFAAIGQDKFTFRYNQEELEEPLAMEDVKEHFLGEDIAVKMQLLKESYTYKEKDQISNSERTVIEKPAIFNSVKKISKYYKKEIKKGKISEEDALTALNNALVIALNIRYQDTQAFEDYLWKAKSPDAMVDVYANSVELDYF
ncbi:MAG: hypothetical protein JXQ90_06845 [Cyclobacteriaceae bacterium]